MYHIIPEKLIENSAEIMRELDPLNRYYFLLEEADLYRAANLTPIYLLDIGTDEVFVTSQEYMSRKFH